jgi:hypothetical protein
MIVDHTEKNYITYCGCYAIKYFVDRGFYEGSIQLCNSCKSNKINEWNKHIYELENITHITNIPIKIAIQKFRVIHCGNSDNWILQNYILSKLKDILLVQKIKNKWVCSKEKLDFTNLELFTKIVEFGIGNVKM